MLVFVDYEHADCDGGWIQAIQAARTWITYRLEDLSGLHCMLVRYDRISENLLDRLDARAIFISGQASDPSRYRPEDLAPLQRIVKTSGLPVFGFCGGWQFLAQTLGADLVPIEVDEAQAETEIVMQWSDGPAEFGYHPVSIEVDDGGLEGSPIAGGGTGNGPVDVAGRPAGGHPLLAGLGPAPVFRHAHALHVPEVPDGFDVVASTPLTPVQMAVDGERRLVGTQFHPEYWTEEHPAGRTLIANFLTWSGVVDGPLLSGSSPARWLH